MPITISYDVTDIENNDRNYMRSMLERFHWKRLGGSVFRYDGLPDDGGKLQEDWLNHVIPSLMFLRSFIVKKKVELKFFTIDSASISFLDHSDPALKLGTAPQPGSKVALGTPTNKQSAEGTIRAFIDAAIAAAG